MSKCNIKTIFNWLFQHLFLFKILLLFPKTFPILLKFLAFWFLDAVEQLEKIQKIEKVGPS